MSVAVDLVKETGPYVIGLAGLYTAYRSGSRQDRIGRHNARAEALYVEMLNALAHQASDAAAQIDPTSPQHEGKTPDSGLSARIRLFAPPPVQDAWGRVTEALGRIRDDALKEPGIDADRHHTLLVLTHAELVEPLLTAMRTDLGIPHHGSLQQRLERRAQRRRWVLIWKFRGDR
jgi:hypothetical protein